MKVKVRPTFILYLLLICLIDGPLMAMSLLSALLIHETAHIAVGYALHEAFDRVELTPFGGVITYKSGRSARKGIKGALIAAAGPASNYAVILLLMNSAVLRRLSDETIAMLLMTNASMLIVNLLPVLPLDGGRIVFSFGYYIFPVTFLITILTAFGMLAGGLFILLAAYGTIALEKLNVSLLAVGTYLMICSWEHSNAMLVDNLYTVIQERRNDASHEPLFARVCAVRRNTVLLSLVPRISRSRKIVCLLESPHGVRLISEDQLLNALLTMPHATFEEAFLANDHSTVERNMQKNILFS